MLFLKLETNEIVAIVTLVPIFLLIIVATVIGLVRRIKMAKLYKKNSFIHTCINYSWCDTFNCRLQF